MAIYTSLLLQFWQRCCLDPNLKNKQDQISSSVIALLVQLPDKFWKKRSDYAFGFSKLKAQHQLVLIFYPPKTLATHMVSPVLQVRFFSHFLLPFDRR